MLNATEETLPNGRKLRVARLGSGPALVMLHGYPDNLQIWCELAPRLAKYFEVIAFDWPGLGSSEGWPGGATPAHMADRLAVLLDSWRIGRATLVGMDMGGQPALVFAARHPDRVDSLVVLNSLVLWDEKTSWEIAILRRYGWNRFFIRRLPRLVFERALATFLPPGTKLPDELRRDFWTSFKTPEVRTFVARMCAGYQGTLPQLPEIYAHVACPTFILWAEHDRHFPPAHAERLHELIPGSHCEIVPGALHWMAWNRAEEIARRIVDFQAGLQRMQSCL
jgi:pimeloyl-ACP methyl ester carboxylesterase